MKPSEAELHKLYTLECKKRGFKPTKTAEMLFNVTQIYSPLADNVVELPTNLFDELPDDAVIQMTKKQLIRLHRSITTEAQAE